MISKVVGVGSQRKLLDTIHSTPGVRLSGVTSDGKGQQYHTPHHLIGSCGSDIIIIVGRGIYEGPMSGDSLRHKVVWSADNCIASIYITDGHPNYCLLEQIIH
ncbi:uncharacterized protein [Dysidea avara]|uniref:uncharacterized protein isoform X2 n=1 Tax=Dysidea avara TaxID=196820 RepID=UPI00332EDF42